MKIKIFKNISKTTMIFLAVGFLLAAPKALAATYYINGASGNDSNPGTIGSPWKTIHKANITMVAGDVVYLRGGVSGYQEYLIGPNGGTSEGINPENSGTKGNFITYSVYPGEKVHLVGQSDTGVRSQGIVIHQRSWIRVNGVTPSGLKISKMYIGLMIGGYPGGDNIPVSYSNSNEISYVWFYDFFATPSWNANFQSNTIRKKVQYNYVHDCIFEKAGYSPTDNDVGVLLDVGIEAGSYVPGGWDDSFNVIEKCEFKYAGHHTLGVETARNTLVRNNYSHNEPWYPYEGNLYGYRNFYSNGYYGYSGYNIYEGNRIGYAGPNVRTDNHGGGGIKLGNSDTILRYNAFFGNQYWNIYLGVYEYGKSRNNYIYNNTIYHGGYYADPRYAVTNNEVFMFAYDSTWDKISSNVIKNNLFHDNAKNPAMSIATGSLTQAWLDYQDPAKGNNVIKSNLNAAPSLSPMSPLVDPKFIDADMSDKTSWVLPNLNLQSDSPAINTATHLTQANGPGSGSTTLVVDDAHYFQDGKFGSASGCDPTQWPGDFTNGFKADWISIGTADNTAEIDSINYSTNAITLKTAKTWPDNANIWLYKKSDGKVVLDGNSPDYGAYEYVPGQQACTPGDANCDGKIDITDFTKLVSNWLKTGAGLQGDVNNDSKVNTQDLGIIMSKWSN